MLKLLYGNLILTYNKNYMLKCEFIFSLETNEIFNINVFPMEVEMNNKLRENEMIELKKTTSELKESLVSIVAILNKHQKGKVYFGVKDDGTVIGQEIGTKTLREVSEAITTKIEPKIYPTVTNVKIDGKDCILVEFEGDNVPYLADGRAYIRVSDQDKKLSVEEMRKILLKTGYKNNKWEEKASNITLDDIDEETLKEFIEKGNKKGRIAYQYTNKIDVLRKLNLIDDKGKIKNAGEVLFGKYPNIQLRVAIFATEEKTTFLDMQDFKGNIFKLIDIGEQYISKNIRWSANFNTGSFAREDIPEIPIRAMREVLCNSFCHRLWDVPYDNDIAIYKDRIEICNPGHFTDEATPEDYITKNEPSRPRNPLIAQIIYLSGEIEKWGSGIKNVYKKCKEDNIKVEFEDRKTAFFVVIYRKDLEELIENTEKNLKNVPQNVPQNVPKNVPQNVPIKYNKTEKKIIDLISENPNITQLEIAEITKLSEKTIKRNMNKLKEKGILKRIGINRTGHWEVNM